jgi:pimeloyl-ACP methyl ester carboxylesterase
VKRYTSFDGTQIAWQRWDSAADTALPPVVLHHGYAVDANVNWVAPGIVAALLAAGRDVVALDARGHGASDKPHSPDRYGEPTMARDLAGLTTELGLDRFDLVGYSMGAIIALLTAASDHRVRRLVVGGVGASVIEQGGVDAEVVRRDALLTALETDDPSTITDAVAARFRALADATGADRLALASSPATTSPPSPTPNSPAPSPASWPRRKRGRRP